MGGVRSAMTGVAASDSDPSDVHGAHLRLLDLEVIAADPELGLLKVVLLTGDLLALALAWMIGAAFRAQFSAGLGSLPLLGTVAVVVTLAVLRQQGLYLARISSQRVVEARGIVRAAVVGALAMVAAAPLLDLRPDWRFAAIFALTAAALVLAFRNTYRAWLASRRRAGQFVRSVLLVGWNDEADKLTELLEDHPELGYRIVGIVGRVPKVVDDSPVRWADDVLDVARRLRVSGAVVIASALTSDQLHMVTRRLLATGVHVNVSSGLLGLSRTRVRPVSLAHEPLLYLEAAALGGWQRALKRGLDVALGTVLLALSLPLWALIAIAIKVDSAGPVFFSQTRVGLEGRLFPMLKFRTMTQDAEAQVASLADGNDRTEGPLFKMASDPRVTRVGRVLRATSLDELPQLLNVVTGTMSLVGPRPAMEHEVQQFDEELRQRLREKPGITGLWQIEARDHPSFRPYRRLDLFYIENWSLALDLLILLGTVTSVSARLLRSMLPARSVPTTVKPL